jgi:hypothetical protein
VTLQANLSRRLKPPHLAAALAFSARRGRAAEGCQAIRNPNPPSAIIRACLEGQAITFESWIEIAAIVVVLFVAVRFFMRRS